MAERSPDVLLSRTLPRPRDPHPEVPHHAGLSRGDVLSALFKHKKKIVLCAILGLAAAAAVYFFYPPVYESQAKLLVRYVIERSGVDPIDSSRTMGQGAEHFLGSEVEILTSWDLAVQAAEAIGVKRLVPNSPTPDSKEAAAAAITAGLEVTVNGGSNIIFVSYRNRDPQLATVVLNELVARYFVKHLEVHRSLGAFDFVTQQTDQVRARLAQTEESLRSLKEKVGISGSLAESTTAMSNQTNRIEDQLRDTEWELAEQQAKVLQLGAGGLEDANSSPSPSAPGGTKTAKTDHAASPEHEIPGEVVQQYQVIVSRLPQLRQAKLDLLAKYTPQNQFVTANQAEIDSLTSQRRELEKKYPDLPSKVGPMSANGEQSTVATETARLAGIVARKKRLTSDLHEIKAQSDALSQIAPQISDLERQRELEEANYKYFAATLEKARIDEALDPSKIPNISAVQRPSPPFQVTKKRDKLVVGLAGGGLALGIALALLKELILNRTVKRAPELERLLGSRPLLSIPFKKNGALPPSSNKTWVGALLPVGANPNGHIAPWEPGHFIRSYCEAIRDRLVLFFELNQLTHKPKMVGVTGLSDAAGTSTLAAGLAAALSETGDGKVLLVDVNLGPQHVHPFFKGKPAYTLKTALQPASDLDSASGNLYLATVASPDAGPAQLGLKKFFELMPNLKASDFDYIIFDMPPLSETSPTIGIAPFMDRVLFVVEAEKNNREAVRQGYSNLISSRNNVSVVLNKSRSYVPKWLEDSV